MMIRLIAEYYLESLHQHVRPLITYWPGKAHSVVSVTGDPRTLILDRPFGVSVACQFVRGYFVLISSVRPSGVLCCIILDTTNSL